MDVVQQYQRQLDQALIAYMKGDEKPFYDLLEEHGIAFPMHPTTRCGGVMKTITARPTLPRQMRQKAKQWLEQHGMESLDDGDLQ